MANSLGDRVSRRTARDAHLDGCYPEGTGPQTPVVAEGAVLWIWRNVECQQATRQADIQSDTQGVVRGALQLPAGAGTVDDAEPTPGQDLAASLARLGIGMVRLAARSHVTVGAGTVIIVSPTRLWT